ncbi:MAG: HAMP domain-containing histidine kinase [Clostridia bacterium]|nr:HAMP domain-containing histidine kinase [Clostridia bacterium]
MKSRGFSLRAKTTIAVLLIWFFSGTISTLLIGFLYWLHFYPIFVLRPVLLGVVILVTAMLVGTFASYFISKHFLSPLEKLTQATKEIAKGNFNVDLPDVDSESEVTELTESFRKMSSDLANMEMFRSNFINNFSHEFKTPIVSISGFAKQLQAGVSDPEKAKEYIDIIAQESERLVSMSTNVLLLTSLENAQVPYEEKEYDLTEQIRSCILLLEKKWTEKNLELYLDLDEVSLLSCEELLHHVWINLLSNAIKFSKDGGTLSVSCHRLADSVEVRIGDCGCGMSEEVLGHIYDRFYQGDSAHSKEGNGLGLSIAQKAVSLCHGTISVSSQIDVGTVFTITIPQPLHAEIFESTNA